MPSLYSMLSRGNRRPGVHYPDEQLAPFGGGGFYGGGGGSGQQGTVTPPPTPQVSPALQELYANRDKVRGLMEGYGKTALADADRTTGRELAGVDTSTAQRGLYSSTVRDALRNRAVESGARTRGYLEEHIAKAKADMESGLSGGISGELSHEEDRRQGYANAMAQAKGQNRGDLLSGLFGLGGAALGSSKFLSLFGL